jgi:starvation-inducible DNA-binding protein
MAVATMRSRVFNCLLPAARCLLPRGGVAEGAARMADKRSSLSEYPTNTVDGRSHVEALSSALAAWKGIDQANELDTADLFTEVSRGIDKWLWFVEAHPQAER